MISGAMISGAMISIRLRSQSRCIMRNESPEIRLQWLSPLLAPSSPRFAASKAPFARFTACWAPLTAPLAPLTTPDAALIACSQTRLAGQHHPLVEWQRASCHLHPPHRHLGQLRLALSRSLIALSSLPF